MKNVRVIVEYAMPDQLPEMRWEHQSDAEGAAVFELLGRAFEVVQREEPTNFATALAAFMRGAMINRQDVEQALDEP